MNSNRKMFFVVLAALAGLGLTMLQAGPTTVSAAPTISPAPVYVTNAGATQSAPVPVNISSTTGTLGVNVLNTPTVALTNDASTPVPIRNVDRPTAQPVNYHAIVQWASGFLFANANATTNYTVPDGKELVVESVSVQIGVPSTGTTPANKVVFARLDTQQAGAAGTIVLSLTDAGVGGDGSEFFTATHHVFAIFGPGTQIIPTAYCNSGGCVGGSAFFMVSGYLVDVT